LKKALIFLKRALWTIIVGLVLAFHQTYEQEFKVVKKDDQEIKEDKEV